MWWITVCDFWQWLIMLATFQNVVKVIKICTSVIKIFVNGNTDYSFGCSGKFYTQISYSLLIQNFCRSRLLFLVIIWDNCNYIYCMSVCSSLQEQKEDLRKRLSYTTHKLELLEREFDSTRQYLETELRRAQEELDKFTDKLRR